MFPRCVCQTFLFLLNVNCCGSFSSSSELLSLVRSGEVRWWLRTERDSRLTGEPGESWECLPVSLSSHICLHTIILPSTQHTCQSTPTHILPWNIEHIRTNQELGEKFVGKEIPVYVQLEFNETELIPFYVESRNSQRLETFKIISSILPSQ